MTNYVYNKIRHTINAHNPWGWVNVINKKKIAPFYLFIINYIITSPRIQVYL